MLHFAEPVQRCESSAVVFNCGSEQLVNINASVDRHKIEKVQKTQVSDEHHQAARLDVMFPQKVDQLQAVSISHQSPELVVNAYFALGSVGNPPEKIAGVRKRLVVGEQNALNAARRIRLI